MKRQQLAISATLLLGSPHSIFAALAPLHSTTSIIRSSRLLASTGIETSASDSRLSELQQRAAPFLAGFAVENFDPVPWMSNCHVQTIGGFLFRDAGASSSYVPKNDAAAVIARIFEAIFPDSDKEEPSVWDSRERIETPDGDWFHADTKYASNKKEGYDAPTVIFLHGLESNSDSPICKEMAQAFNSHGMNCVCLNFRGCSGTPNDKVGGYHLGFTDDLKQYLSLMKERGNKSPIYLSGFSLGANTILKCLGELGEAAVAEYGIAGAAAFCAPLDQSRNSFTLAQPGINREIYTNKLLRTMKERAVYQLERFCDGDEDTDKFDYKGVISAETITDYDEAFIARIYGFKDCWDYYQQTSSIFYLDKIAVPTLILNAKDDPFFDPESWPVEKSVEHGGTAPLKMIRMDKGGHLGFFFHQVEGDDDRLVSNQPSWAVTELGRFLGHVQSHESVTLSK